MLMVKVYLLSRPAISINAIRHIMYCLVLKTIIQTRDPIL